MTMTMYEVLKLNEGLMQFLVEKDVQPADVQYVPMYAEYLRMKGEGHKLVYIVAFLQDEYGVSESTVYRVLRRFKKEVM